MTAWIEEYGGSQTREREANAYMTRELIYCEFDRFLRESGTVQIGRLVAQMNVSIARLARMKGEWTIRRIATKHRSAGLANCECPVCVNLRPLGNDA